MPLASPLKLFSKRKKRLPEDIQLRFLKRMHRFLSSGYTLQDTLDAIRWDKELADPATFILESIKRGDRLDHTFQEAGFHHSISSFLYFVNVNSNLVASVRKCSEMMEHRLNYNKKFKTTIRYPLLLLIIFSIILVFINHRVLPTFQSLLPSSSSTLSTVTVLKWAMDAFQFSFFSLCLFLLIISISWRHIRKRIPIEEQLKFLVHIPIYRHYLRLQTSFQFATHFSSLLKAGLSLKAILHELSSQEQLPILSYYTQLLINTLERGVHISRLLEELPFIEKHLAAIFQKNATTIDLERDLTLYSDMLLDEIERMIIKIITLIQPVFYIAIGVFIVFIYFSLMWPMFQLINTF